MHERVLASVKAIDSVHPIEGADAIELVHVGGWSVVAAKGEYKVDMLATYVEIDSWIPTSIAPFLSKGKPPKSYKGVLGERLKTVKIRGQLSQGLLLPADPSWTLGQDVTDALGIFKWEAQIPPELAGIMKGDFPCFIPKTSQERIQNVHSNTFQLYSQMKWEVTEKLDGSSMTVFINDMDEFCVCSRNVNLAYSKTNAFWNAAQHQQLEPILRDNRGLAIQGELIGEGIQKNPYKISLKTSKAAHVFYVFDIYDVNKGVYFNAEKRQAFVKKYGLVHVPILQNDATFGQDARAELLQHAEGKSVVCKDTDREGLVYKCMSDPECHFKVISNAFLLKHQ